MDDLRSQARIRLLSTRPNGDGARLRVLVVGPVSESGGLARVARMTTEGFDPQRFDIAVCDTARDTPANRSFWAACRSHLGRWMRLVRLLSRHRPDVVHLHTCSYATFYRTVLDVVTCRVLRGRYVLHVHGGLFGEFLASVRGIRRWLVVGVLRGAARVIVLGEVWRTKLTQQAGGLKLSVIRNGVEPSADVRCDERRGAGVLFVGDLSEPKRPDDLLVAYAALPSPVRARYPLTVVGGGEASRQRWLTELAQRLGVADAVRFRGPQEHDTVRSMMHRADLFVLPSRAEGMPLALLEAMQAGLPAVATRVGAVPEMVTDGVEAALVAAQDTLALTRRMNQLLSDEGQRREMGRAARQRAGRELSAAQFRSAIAALWTEVAPAVVKTVAPPLPRLASWTFRSLF